MYVVTNTIRVRKGSGPKLIERFKSPKEVHQMPGFKRLELWKTENDKDDTEEYKVCTVWENEQSFIHWLKSDAFRRVHDAKEKGFNDFVIDSKLSKHSIVAGYTVEEVLDSKNVNLA
jgi:heme oxygenase (staphylobilin-producing)